MLALIGVFAWSRALQPAHVERVELVSWYWHFVDAAGRRAHRRLRDRTLSTVENV